MVRAAAGLPPLPHRPGDRGAVHGGALSRPARHPAQPMAQGDGNRARPVDDGDQIGGGVGAPLRSAAKPVSAPTPRRPANRVQIASAKPSTPAMTNAPDPCIQPSASAVQVTARPVTMRANTALTV